ncbi:hypothetical protein GGTG_07262 [Gaeumannomyces tritici R3-111a-1]|uniref:Uncharacterized protein n=1 Tax=Gaeumannomyces tritici (strain R3-111a-1) TaxID=644352 RepID=J3P165_GAET3|nr:hypothetical protein GGTG_07262 [Gaeumannomyces tritici R3-111a-1]EJT77350.1 hypothetical protein GGTG_07262 [Gaeumannomyces tritici R3-111a-1]
MWGNEGFQQQQRPGLALALPILSYFVPLSAPFILNPRTHFGTTTTARVSPRRNDTGVSASTLQCGGAQDL